MNLEEKRAEYQKRYKLIKARALKNWTQAELAELLEVQPNTVSLWERGKQDPSPFYRQKLCHVFQMSAEDLDLSARRMVYDEPAHIDEELHHTLSENVLYQL